ncbi:cysteine hydrolase family protein [Cochlodiniinecator piscidefendens]|uniref:cysteine hydrolase family protein n=1 Tax=Cochlodiniinecator piscidefendens TaxID=2715756 RepID=UPI00140BF78E|nr:isochorismatase family protein [Cochlodiniinecator piscidefendens]
MIWITLIILALVIWCIIGARRIGTISNGSQIPADATGRALVIIDAQDCFLKKYDEAAVNALGDEIKQAKFNGIPVIGLRHEWKHQPEALMMRVLDGGTGVSGTKGLQINADLRVELDHTVDKFRQDGFHDGALDQLLRDLNVGHITIAGLDGNFCIQATAQAALNRGYSVKLSKSIFARASDQWENTKANLIALGAHT